MKALRVHGYGPQDGIVLDEVPLPEPGPGQLRVRVAACGISFVDRLPRAATGKIDWRGLELAERQRTLDEAAT